MKKSVLFLAEAAVIAALYYILTVLLWQFSSFGIQIRLSEALIMFTCFTSASVPGLFIGCFLANLTMGGIIDAVFGALTTLAGAFFGRAIVKGLEKRNRPKAVPFLAPVPNILLNAVAVPLILVFGYGIRSFGSQTSTTLVLLLNGLSVFIGEALSSYVFGLPLYFAVKKLRALLFPAK